jgi:hypothetical protein
MSSLQACLRRPRTWFDIKTAVQRLDEAEKRSQHLLRSLLSPEQLRQYDTFGYFMVVGCDTGRCYRISRGRAFNIHELDADAREHCTWCFAPYGVATGDINLAQKIALENFENRALRVANRCSASTWHSVPRPSEPRSWMRS